MPKAQENWKIDIKNINDKVVIDKVRNFILGIFVQKGIEEQKGKTGQYG